MIKFSCKKRHKDQTPIVSDAEIAKYAEELVGDYKPHLLIEAGPINADHFLESYLGATVEYQDIYYEDGASPIAGATVFNDDLVRVFDKDAMSVRAIEVKANTILIDNSTVEEGKEGYAKFTKLHEGGHFLIHPEVYLRMGGQVSLFEVAKTGNNVVCCRRSFLEGYYSHGRRSRNWSQEQFREHHANVFAAFVSMPRQTFVPLAVDLNKKAGFKDGIYVEDTLWDWEYDAALCRNTERLASIYGVSRAAVKIHLRTLGLLMTKAQYDYATTQMAIAF